MTNNSRNFEELQEYLEYEFSDLQLLYQALIHRSFVNENEDVNIDNERLEYLGDAILDFIVADMLYRKFPNVAEGELTKLRSAMVRTDSLAELAIGCHIGDYLLIGKGEEVGGGRERLYNLCCGFEAIVGAMYLDGGLPAVKDFAEPKLEALLDHVLEYSLHTDARSELQEWSQAQFQITPVYEVVDTTGPDHEKEFIVEVLVGDRRVGQGRGSSKRSAAQSAARNAMQNLAKDGWTVDPITK